MKNGVVEGVVSDPHDSKYKPYSTYLRLDITTAETYSSIGNASKGSRVIDNTLGSNAIEGLGTI